MAPGVYERLLDTSRPVDVSLPDRSLGGGADWWDRATWATTRKGRWEAVTWLRGPTVLTLLAVPPPVEAPTGSLGRVLRRRRSEVR